MTLATLDNLVAGLTGGIQTSFWKAAPANLSAAPVFGSYWAIGGNPGAGATPPSGAGAAPDNTTAGAISFTNPAGGKSSYLAGFEGIMANTNAVLFLYDRLVHTSGLSGTVTGAQTDNSAAITRPDANGANAELFLEIYTALGASPQTATVSYTNQAGTAGRSGTASIPASAKAASLYQVSLAAGDTGVRSVQTVSLSASTGTVGNFGVTIGRRIALLPTNPQNGPASAAMDPFACGLVPLPNSACLWLVPWGANSPSVGAVAGMMNVAQV